MLGSAAPAAAGVCRDVLLVGVDGGGERPGKGRVFGPTVDRFRTAYAALAAKGGRTVDVRRVPIHADAPRALLRKKGPEGNARKALEKARVKAWRKPVPHVVGRTMKVLTKADGGLPRAAGGARRLLARRGGHAPRAAPAREPPRRPRPRGRGRADRRPRPGGQDLRHGRRRPARPPWRSRRVRPRADARRPTPPLRTATFGVWQVCTRGDLVCAPKDNSVKAALKVARSYHERARRARRTPRRAQRLVQHRPRAHPDPADAVGLDATGPAVLRPARRPREVPSRGRVGQRHRTAAGAHPGPDRVVVRHPHPGRRLHAAVPGQRAPRRRRCR